MKWTGNKSVHFNIYYNKKVDTSRLSFQQPMESALPSTVCQYFMQRTWYICIYDQNISLWHVHRSRYWRTLYTNDRAIAFLWLSRQICIDLVCNILISNCFRWTTGVYSIIDWVCWFLIMFERTIVVVLINLALDYLRCHFSNTFPIHCFSWSLLTTTW